MKELKQKIKDRKITIGVIGLGYVGLPLACEFSESGVKVLGFDISTEKVALVNEGKSYIGDVPDSFMKEQVSEGRLSATTDFSRLKEVDAISICVPTPLRKTKDPDMSFIAAALAQIKTHIRRGQVITLESTTYPGTTEEFMLPELEENGFKVGVDFCLAFSPERVDPGNAKFGTKNTPKILGGVTPLCTELAQDVYQLAIQNVIPVSSPKTAEMVKLLENTFRSVNIGMANEMALMCNKLGVNVWEVIEAAATKPFGFMPFYPGPGLGGHCIPIDPFYLSWKLKTLNYDARFIALAGEVNQSMPHYVVEKITAALNQRKKSVNGSNIFILGAAYKNDIDDVRESPALDIIAMLQELGATVTYHDPFVPSLETHHHGPKLKSVQLTEEALKNADCVAIITSHKGFDIDFIVKNSPVLLDTRNATKGRNEKNIIRL